ncbi:MAG: 50S ribosomal protein L24 [Candidatus Paceibacterota bacterium]
MIKAKIKKGDLVMMLKGKDRKKSGRVLKVLRKEGKVIVEGLNLVKKFQRPKKEGEKGEIVSVSRAVPLANVALVCPHCQKPTRVGIMLEKDKKYRFCKKCQQKISEIK